MRSAGDVRDAQRPDAAWRRICDGALDIRDVDIQSLGPKRHRARHRVHAAIGAPGACDWTSFFIEQRRPGVRERSRDAPRAWRPRRRPGVIRRRVPRKPRKRWSVIPHARLVRRTSQSLFVIPIQRRGAERVVHARVGHRQRFAQRLRRRLRPARAHPSHARARQRIHRAPRAVIEKTIRRHRVPSRAIEIASGVEFAAP
mmetsp:Transcript_3300/g.11915  ORF Transcript_3300/g.11915 Transcript_3300/m.11915 type:complete len:200 (+) Transcript_3300:2841-3440(+)